MKLTNFFKLPQPIYDAVANDPYNRGDCDYSITGLLTPPRISRLTEIHNEVLTEDAADRIFSLIGQVVHGILERAEREAVAEGRLFMNIGGKLISGQLDRFHIVDKHIQDYKVVSVWKVKDGVPKEFEEQLNSYVELARANGHQVISADIVALLRDWKKRQSRTTEGYPTHQAKVLPINVWPRERAQAFIIERIRIHESAKKKLPECTLSDRWNSGDTFAVYKGAGRRAVRVYETLGEAKEHCAAFGSEYHIVERSGENIRCADYCLVSEHCQQWLKLRSP